MRNVRNVTSRFTMTYISKRNDLKRGRDLAAFSSGSFMNEKSTTPMDITDHAKPKMMT